MVRAIVCSSVAIEDALRSGLAHQSIETVSSVAELDFTATDPDSIVFIDLPALEAMPDDRPLPWPVVGVCDGTLQAAIAWLAEFPWLSQVISTTLLQQPFAKVLLTNLIASFADREKHLLDRMRDSLSGRRVGLNQASRRVERLEKMSDFFGSNGIGSRSIQLLRDAAEELLTNAFYDAPVAAGAVSSPISRMQDVVLPDETPCDLMYGCSEDFAMVRVRDPFGALSRTRIVDVLTRCARSDMGVEVDESMGGAGLGLWRVFSVASFVAISVVRGHHTDILVGIGKQRSPGGTKPYAVHFFFRDAAKQRMWQIRAGEAVEHTFVTDLEGP